MTQRERKRERERRNRMRRKYGQAKPKHAKRGIISCILAGVVLLILTVSLVTAYRNEGTAKPIIGAFGLIALILSGCGLYMGVKGFKEREKDYITCKVGVACCASFIFIFILIFCRGLLF